MNPPLHDWETFYVIIGSSAAALTGLQFVVIALISDARHIEPGTESVSAFGTPTIVHFCAVLLISAICSMPGHTASTLSWSLALFGIAGIVYVIEVTRRARRQTAYQPVLEDWVWHTILPMISYLVLLIGTRRCSSPRGSNATGGCRRQGSTRIETHP